MLQRSLKWITFKPLKLRSTILTCSDNGHICVEVGKSTACLPESNNTKGFVTQSDDQYLQVTEDKRTHDYVHVPVMLKQVLDVMEPKSDKVFLDMTFGGGGHTRALIECGNNIKVFALDRDPDSHKHAESTSKYIPNIIPLLGKFSDIHTLLPKYNILPNSLDGVLFDVGVSSFQFDIPERGFSLSKDGPLDMRMGKDRDPHEPSAADVVNLLDENDLFKVLKYYGEEKRAKDIANSIVKHRTRVGRITTTKDLASVVEKASIGKMRYNKLHKHAHVATKTFQALRSFVNNEFNELYNGLDQVYQFLKPGGVCAVIAFHSLEDRIIKRIFHGINMDDKFNKSIADHRRQSSGAADHVYHSENDIKNLLVKKWKPLSRKPILPSQDEVYKNPRARSAKLRAAIKLEEGVKL